MRVSVLALLQLVGAGGLLGGSVGGAGRLNSLQQVLKGLGAYRYAIYL